MRKVILHYHLFKNAGTSIDRALGEAFGDRWLSHDRSDPGAKIPPVEMERFILDHPDAIAFSSHQVVPPLPARHVKVLPIVLLRHPIDRAYSAYLFDSRPQQGRALPTVTFEDYLAQSFKVRRGNAIEDCQTLQLANREYERWIPSSELDDEEALANAQGFLREIRYFGIVDQYDRSLGILNRRLAADFPGLSLPSYRENVGEAQAELPIGARVERVRSELSSGAFEELTRRNQLDSRLYAYAVRLFSEL